MPSSEPPSPSIALFDLDHTLLAGDSNALWLGFLAERGLIDGAAIMERQARYLTDYTAGRLDILAYLEFQLEPLAGRTLESLNPLLEAFSATQLAPRIAPGAASLIAHHRAQGHRCAIVSATHRFLDRYPALHRSRSDRWPIHRPHQRRTLLSRAQDRTRAQLAGHARRHPH